MTVPDILNLRTLTEKQTEKNDQDQNSTSDGHSTQRSCLLSHDHDDCLRDEIEAAGEAPMIWLGRSFP